MKIKKIFPLLLVIILLTGIFTHNAYSKSKITLNKKNISMLISESYKLTLKGAESQKVKWYSSNKKIASVKNGLVKAKNKGKCNVIAKYLDKKYRCSVQVKDDKMPYATSSVAIPVPSQPVAPIPTASPSIETEADKINFSVEKFIPETMHISISIENSTSDVVTMDNEFSLERYDNGQWIFVQQKICDIPAIAIYLDTNNKIILDIALNEYYEILPNGQYQISKQIFPYGKISAKFNIL